MKRHLLSAVILLFFLNASSQSITLNVLKKADEAYQEFSYSKAVEYYRLALKEEESQAYITSQIALSYRNLNESDSAEVWLKKAIELGQKNPEFNFYLAEALLSNQKYEEAKQWYTEYSGQVNQDGRSQRKLAALDDFDQFFSNEQQIEVESIPSNSPGLDFSPAFYKNGILFVSSRPRSAWIGREFNWDESGFLDLHYLSQDSIVEYFDKGLNTKYHEGPLVMFNRDRSVVYTRNNYDGKRLNRDKEGVTNLKLFFAEWDAEAEQWTNEISFEHNNDSYSISSPAINEDGTILIFSSDKPGGFGASDLYISLKTEQGWSDPRNLGASVNTKGRDGFPFLYDDQLYFSSEGLEGLGGLDMYSISFDGQSVFGEAKNLGSPLNSSKDDFGIIRKGKKGYFSSNRNNKTSDDIFRYSINEPDLVLITGEVYDIETDQPILKSDVFFRNVKGGLLYTRSFEQGKYEVYASANSEWKITSGKYLYELVSPVTVQTTSSLENLAERIYLRKIGDNQLDTLDIPDATLIVDNRIKEYESTSHFVDEFVNGDTLKTAIIYYDLDGHSLRLKSEQTLNDVVNFMIEHVDVRIILSSHTDSRSSLNYNKRLSKRRSTTARNYLIEMGVDPDRMAMLNYGEERLTNQCADNDQCGEEQHQQNRRTELLLLKEYENSDSSKSSQVTNLK